MREKSEALFKKLGLGTIYTDPAPVTGGLLHRMYRVESSAGIYAVKHLDANIMARPEAKSNMIRSEKIAHLLKNRIPLCAAMGFSGQHLIEHGSDYFLIYHWVHGSSVFAPEITTSHCSKIGHILSLIHSADISLPGYHHSSNRREAYDWQSLLKEAKSQNGLCLSAFEPNYDLIVNWDKKAVEGLAALDSKQVISHCDLDPKNVMWHTDDPVVIDWEAAGYTSPAQELITTLNYWCVDVNGELDREKFTAFMTSYRRNHSISGTNWKHAVDSSFDSMSGWLEYNIKRALGLEGGSDADAKDGLAQVIKTIDEMTAYSRQTEKLKEWLNAF